MSCSEIHWWGRASCPMEELLLVSPSPSHWLTRSSLSPPPIHFVHKDLLCPLFPPGWGENYEAVVPAAEGCGTCPFPPWEGTAEGQCVDGPLHGHHPCCLGALLLIAEPKDDASRGHFSPQPSVLTKGDGADSPSGEGRGEGQNLETDNITPQMRMSEVGKLFCIKTVWGVRK